MENQDWEYTILKYTIPEYRITWKNLWKFFLRLIGYDRCAMEVADKPYTISLWYRKGETGIQVIREISDLEIRRK